MNDDFEIIYIASISLLKISSEEKQSAQTDCERMVKVIGYVKANLDEVISLKQVAAIACMTEQSFCRFF